MARSQRSRNFAEECASDKVEIVSVCSSSHQLPPAAITVGVTVGVQNLPPSSAASIVLLLPTVDFNGLNYGEHQTSQKTIDYLGGHLGTRIGHFQLIDSVSDLAIYFSFFVDIR
jgi:hypothetical protein